MNDIPDNIDDVLEHFLTSKKRVPVEFGSGANLTIVELMETIGRSIKRIQSLTKNNAPLVLVEKETERNRSYQRALIIRKTEYLNFVKQTVLANDMTDDQLLDSLAVMCSSLMQYIEDRRKKKRNGK